VRDNGNDRGPDHDFIIIGAGPGGLQLGYYLETAGLDYLILESGAVPGSFFKTFPRHRHLISVNKLYTGHSDPEINLRWDWNSLLSDENGPLFKHYSKRYFPEADDMVRYLADYAGQHGLKIRYNTRVERIARQRLFSITDHHGNVYSCRVLVVATGVAAPHTPDIPGIELAEQYAEVSVNPQDFVNQRVLILGKGNSGFETAQNLVETAAVIHLASPNTLMLAWRTHYVGHLRAVNNDVLDTYQLKSQNGIIDATIDRIDRRDDKYTVRLSYTHADGEVEELTYDRVIVCTGFRFDNSIFDQSCNPVLAIGGRFPDQTCEWESTNVRDLFFAGTLTQMRDFKKSTSAFIHGFRYNARVLYNIFERKYRGRDWPSRRLALTANALMETIIERVNRTSALWQQFGFLCDLIIIDGRNDEARYFEELPFDYVRRSSYGENDHYYTVTLEYGPDHLFADPFNVQRIPRDRVDQSTESSALHPIIRRYRGSDLIGEHHVIEDIAADWSDETHRLPLLQFFMDQLAAPSAGLAGKTGTVAV
jgi:thioredoxin reductase